MTHAENQQVINLQVTDGLAVAILQHQDHEFLMPTSAVAKGYGVSDGTVRRHKLMRTSEFIENVHFIYGVQNLNSAKMTMTYWTKAGVIRLGFFIKSERAKLFRDWAEKLVLTITAPSVVLPPVSKRGHNRLTQERLVSLLADIAQIDDKAIRLSLIEKLGL